MSEIIGRDYCIKHPLEIIRHFGAIVFLEMFFGRYRSLLDAVTKTYERRGISLPGFVGKSYRIAALIEYRASRIYGKMARKFAENEAIRDFYEVLSREEEEHARLMLLCLYTVAMKPSIQYVPSVRDKAIRSVTSHLRQLERTVETLSFDEALEYTEMLEKSEINTIFEKLLRQAENSKNFIFVDKFQEMERHADCISKQIRALKCRHAGHKV